MRKDDQGHSAFLSIILNLIKRIKMKLSINLLKLSILLPFLVNAQIFNPGSVLERKAVNKTNQVINKEADRAIDSIFGAPKKTDNKQTTPPQNNKAQPKTTETKQVNPPKTDTAVKQSPGNQPTVQINSKFDFTPGEKVIFFDDFTAENIGDFPIQWNTTGSGEVVTTNIADGRWFNITNGRGATTLDEPVE